VANADVSRFRSLPDTRGFDGTSVVEVPGVLRIGVVA
jgi:hypothetical protein